MTAEDTRTSKPKRRWLQYRLRTLLVLALVGALLFPWLARWINRPSETVSVKLTSKGMVFWGGELLPMEELAPILRREARVLKRFGFSPFLIIEAHVDTPTKDVQRLAAIGQEAGFEKFALRPAQYPMPER